MPVTRRRWTTWLALGCSAAAIAAIATIAVHVIPAWHLATSTAPGATTSPVAPAVLTRPLDWAPRVALLAGDGRIGWRDGAAAQARFADPYGVAIGADGTVYV